MAQIFASMAGTVLSVSVSVGDAVQEGQDVVTLESMKMEVPISADSSGTIKAVHVQAGDFVNEGDPLVDIE